MERDIYTVVTKQLVEATDEFDRIERRVKRLQAILDRENVCLAKACERMIDMEEIDNRLT